MTILVPNVPTDEGRELGRELAKLYDAESPPSDDRCPGCAFRSGTDANGCWNTVRDATKAALEKTPPFRCHETGKVCAGWLAVSTRAADAVQVPWSYSRLAYRSERRRLDAVPSVDGGKKWA